MTATIGPAGLTVAANIERLRRERRLSIRELSKRLGDAGRPTLPSAVHAIIQGTRRVDADDLAALAKVLDVPPAELLEERPAATFAGLAEAIALITARAGGERLPLSGDVPPAAIIGALVIVAGHALAQFLPDRGARLLEGLGLAAAREDTAP